MRFSSSLIAFTYLSVVAAGVIPIAARSGPHHYSVVGGLLSGTHTATARPTDTTAAGDVPIVARGGPQHYSVVGGLLSGTHTATVRPTGAIAVATTGTPIGTIQSSEPPSSNSPEKDSGKSKPKETHLSHADYTAVPTGVSVKASPTQSSSDSGSRAGFPVKPAGATSAGESSVPTSSVDTWSTQPSQPSSGSSLTGQSTGTTGSSSGQPSSWSSGTSSTGPSTGESSPSTNQPSTSGSTTGSTGYSAGGSVWSSDSSPSSSNTNTGSIVGGIGEGSGGLLGLGVGDLDLGL